MPVIVFLQKLNIQGGRSEDRLACFDVVLVNINIDSSCDSHVVGKFIIEKYTINKRLFIVKVLQLVRDYPDYHEKENVTVWPFHIE